MRGGRLASGVFLGTRCGPTHSSPTAAVSVHVGQNIWTMYQFLDFIFVCLEVRLVIDSNMLVAN